MRLNTASLLESARVGADSLRSNPLRTILATTGVIIGVASLVAAFAITDGVEVWSRALIARESSVQDVAVTARTREQVRGRSISVRGYPRITTEDAARAGAEVPGVIRHALMLNGRSEAELLDARATLMLTLCTASLADFSGLELAAGRFFTAAEDAHGSPVIVLGHRSAAELAGVHDALWLVGRSIRVGGERREVVGVLTPPAGGDASDMVAFAPLRGGEALLEPSSAPRVPTLRLKARSIEAVDTLRLAAVNWLAERYGRGVEKLDVQVGTERLANTRQAMLLSKLLLGLLASLILAVGGIGIMNVLLAAVVERTREIGIRKAVGARGTDIQAQFLMESVTVTTVGSAIGFIGGLVIALAGTAAFRRWSGAGIYPVLHVSTAAIAVGAAVVVGVVFGTYPARRAARLSPIDAIARE
ncbi:MAG TPA: ABC transporter permease [Gemmatimonadaceae bacterium]|jgi:putative ABC transport system permease protein|nr:ABC transporter permease [Gemmatimonadaceae bacterium]